MNIAKMSIKEVERLLETDRNPELLNQLENDKRLGIQRLLNKMKREEIKQKERYALYKEMSQYERKLRQAGKRYIAGVDEVGRGCLAGPVVAAAVILPEEPILGLFDSKKVSARRRLKLYEQIIAQGTVGFGIITAETIDKYNIYEATKFAMREAILNCSQAIEHVLIDAMEVTLPIPQTSLVQGDQKSVSIAAASIVAKVKRDNLMRKLAKIYPAYGFERNVGYGTKEHLSALEKYGATRIHRHSFSPVSAVLSKKME